MSESQESAFSGKQRGGWNFLGAAPRRVDHCGLVVIFDFVHSASPEVWRDLAREALLRQLDLLGAPTLARYASTHPYRQRLRATGLLDETGATNSAYLARCYILLVLKHTAKCSTTRVMYFRVKCFSDLFA